MADRMYITATEYRDLPLGGVKNVSLKSDTLLQHYIAIATANVEAFTERIFAEQEYTEVFLGDNSLTFLCDQYPLTQISEVKDVTANVTEPTANLVQTTVNLNCGRIELTGGGTIKAFSSGNIYSVKYKAGFTSVPVAVKHATALWVTELLQPDYLGPTEGQPDIAALSSQQISDLLTPLRRRRI